MRAAGLFLCLALAATAARAGPPDVALVPLSGTTVAVGGSLDFEVRFSQYQENWSFDNADGEPTPDIGFQTWRSRYHEAWHDTLTDLRLSLGAPGGPFMAQLSQPQAPPGTDVGITWLGSLRFDQPGSYLVVAGAEAWQNRFRRIGATVGTRECVGFDNSVQCTAWTFQEELLEDSSWTELSQATSLAVLVQVVPEPATALLWAGGLAVLAGAAARGHVGRAGRPGRAPGQRRFRRPRG